MNKRLIFALAALMIATLACSTISIHVNSVNGSGNVISETRSLSGFDSVSLEGSGDVSIAMGDTESVVVEADDNIVPLIETTVRNGTLVIGTKDNTNLTTRNGIHIRITMKSLKGLFLRGSGEIKASGVDGDQFEIQLSGSGNITVEGTAKGLKISLPGSGNVTADGLKVQSAVISLNGSGNITAYASESLEATLNGSGTIRYSGSPAQVSKSIHGSGTITP